MHLWIDVFVTRLSYVFTSVVFARNVRYWARKSRKSHQKSQISHSPRNTNVAGQQVQAVSTVREIKTITITKTITRHVAMD